MPARARCWSSKRVDNDPEARLRRWSKRSWPSGAECGPVRVGLDMRRRHRRAGRPHAGRRRASAWFTSPAWRSTAPARAPRGRAQERPEDAAVIAEQVRVRAELRPIEPLSELDAEIRLLVGRRRDLVRRPDPAPQPVARSFVPRSTRASSGSLTRPPRPAWCCWPLCHPGRDPPRRADGSPSTSWPGGPPAARRGRGARRRSRWMPPGRSGRRARRARRRRTGPRARRRGARRPRPARRARPRPRSGARAPP